MSATAALGAGLRYHRTVLRQGFAAFAFVALRFSGAPGCGGVDNPQGGTNAPCTRSSDCGGSLACLAGVCRDPDGDDGSLDSGTQHESSVPDDGEENDVGR